MSEILPNIQDLEQRIRNLEQENVLLREKVAFDEIFREYTHTWKTFRDKDSEVFYVSSSFNYLTGFDRSDYILGKITFLDTVHPDDREMVERYCREEVIAKHQKFHKEYRILRPTDGQTRWVMAMGEIDVDSNFEIILRVGTVQDITERKKKDEELLKTNRLFAVISNISQAIIHFKDRQSLLEEICRIVIERGEFRMAWIGEVDEQTKLVNPITIAGFEGGYLSMIKKISIENAPEGLGPTGAAIREGRHFVSEDIETDPRMVLWKNEALKRGYRSSISLPIKIADKVVGAFTIYSSISKFFDQKEVQLLTEVAHDIGFALGVLELEQERAKIVQALRESEERYRLLFETAQESIVVAQGTNIVYFNPMSLEITGYSGEELLAINFLHLIYPDDRALMAENYKKRLAGEEVAQRYNIRILKKNGEFRWVQISGVRLEWKGAPATFNFVNDIHEQRMAEIALLNVNQNLVESQKQIEENLRHKNALIEELSEIRSKLETINSTKDKFFSIIAHDLRNPLGSFREITRLLYDEYDTFNERERKEFLEAIKDSSKALYLLLENLLEWSRSQRGLIQFNPESFQIAMVVQNCLDILRLSTENKKIQLLNKVPSDAHIVADAKLVTTIIRNLISNAIKFTPKNGTIEVNLRQDEREYIICVSDSGIGMSSTMLKKLFRIDMNVTNIGTAGERGTGLGLILCKEFVNMHAGRIWAESEIGKGSTFCFALPRRNPS